MRLLLLLTAATLGLACSSTSIEVGSYSVANAEDASGWTKEEACALGKQLPILGTWAGTRSELTPSGSDLVELVITHANATLVCGTLTFGREGPAWPPIRDYNVGYPPDLASFQSSFETYIAGLEGVPRTITGGAVEMPRFDPADPTRRSLPIRFRASYGQWRSWCSLQTPYACEGAPGPEYHCVPASGSGGLEPRVHHTEGGGCFTEYGGAPYAVDCGKATLCFGGPCTCTSKRCAATPYWGSQYELTFQGDTAVGSGMALTRMQ